MLVTNARVIDGTGSPARDGAVAIAGGHIVEVLDGDAATAAAGRAARVIDAAGRVVAPGFIDTHSHSDMPLVTDGNAQSKIRQGVTTEVIGESGSIAPQPAATADQPWTDFAGYFAVLEKRGIAVNLLSYVGLGTVRELVIGDGNRKPTADELQKMQGIVTAAMQQGVEGVSTGLIYPPNAYADLDELVALSTPAAAMGGRYASHLRHDGKRLRDGIEEAIAIGERAKIPVHVFHIKVTGQQNFGRMKEVIELVEAAQARGVKVTADVYPYVASSTSLTATLPQWAMDGGADKLVERLSDRATRARIKRDMEDPNATWDNRYQSAGTWANVQLASIGRRRGLPSDTENPHARYEGMRVADAAKTAGKDPFEFVFDLLRDTRGGVSCVYFIMSEDDVEAGAAPAVDRRRLGRLGAGDRGAAARRRAASAQLRHLPARAREVRARGAGHRARGSHPQDDLAAGGHARPHRPRLDRARQVGGPGHLRSGHGGRPGDLRGPVPVPGRHRHRDRQRPGGAARRPAHQRAAGQGAAPRDDAISRRRRGRTESALADQ